MIEPIYHPKPGHKMRVVLLFSGGASALKFLVEKDENLGKKYEFVGAFTNNPRAAGIELAEQAGIPVEILDYRQFIRERSQKFSDPEARRAYFGQVVRLIEKWKPDLVIHSGFMLIATEPYLGRFRNKILNVHPADLTLVDKQGKRKYTGLHVVEQTLADGETSTRSTVHLVTAGVDEGPIVALSDKLPVEPGISAEEHQEKMKWACDGPAYQRALELIADGRVWYDTETGRISTR